MKERGRIDPELVFLLDVDNTLLDNDRLKTDIDSALRREIGETRTERFWQLYEEVRRDEDFVDYPGTIQRLAAEEGDPETGKRLDALLWNVSFRDYVYPGAFETLQHLESFGTCVILSDGDPVFQPLKIEKSGLSAAVGGNVLIYVHKELELAKVFARYPAGHYVMVDDKPRILSILERDCPTAFTTVLVLQGHYGRAGEYQPPPDWVIPHIADLQSFTKEQFLQGQARWTSKG